jgi:hypothetical protein
MRLGRLLRNAGVVVLALIAGLAVFVQIQQHIFRWRAERLLADMRELQSHKSTWVDAQKIMERWGAWGSYEGACAAERCEYRLIIVDTISALVWANVDRYPFLRTLSLPCMFLGEKDAFIVATLDIKNGIVEKSSYQLDFGEIFARANAVNEFEPYIAWDQRMLHPEYWVGKNGACTGCIKFETGFTPLAGREKIRELTDFNFSCITRLWPCTTEADIMPTAWKQYQEERPGNVARWNAFVECKAPLEFYGSENSSIAIVDVISRHGPMASGGSTDWSARVRIIRSLKGEMPWPQDKILTASESDRGEEIHGRGSTDMLAGKQYIVFGEIEEYPQGKKVLMFDNCGVVPYNEQNLSAILRGIDASLVRHIPKR